MDIAKITLVYFSPTRTTQKTLDAIANAMSIAHTEIIDITLPQQDHTPITFSQSDFVLFGAPVYSGRIPAEAAERLQRFRGNNTPAATVVVYGNRAYEDALLELKNIAVDAGFTTVAGGAFIGEHSFSSDLTPIAPGRPDTNDLSDAAEFGKKIAEKIQQARSVEELPLIEVPGNFPYKEGFQQSQASTLTDDDLCTMCETCATVCPTGAISYEDTVITDKLKCTLCCACVRVCPVEARQFALPPLIEKAKSLSELCKKPKKAEIFL